MTGHCFTLPRVRRLRTIRPMDAWKSEIPLVLNAALGMPETTVESVVLSIVTLLVGLIVMLNTGDKMGLTNMSVPRALVSIVILVGLAVVAAVALRLYAVDSLPRELQGWSVTGILVMMYLIAMVPILCAVYRANYVDVLIPVSVSVLAAVAVLMVTQAAFSGLRSGGVSFGKIKDRTGTHETFLNR